MRKFVEMHETENQLIIVFTHRVTRGLKTWYPASLTGVSSGPFFVDPGVRNRMSVGAYNVHANIFQ